MASIPPGGAAGAAPAASVPPRSDLHDSGNSDNSKDDRDGDVIPEPIRELLPATLSRLAAGLPMHELDIIIKEAKACEDAL